MKYLKTTIIVIITLVNTIINVNTSDTGAIGFPPGFPAETDPSDSSDSSEEQDPSGIPTKTGMPGRQANKQTHPTSRTAGRTHDSPLAQAPPGHLLNIAPTKKKPSGPEFEKKKAKEINVAETEKQDSSANVAETDSSGYYSFYAMIEEGFDAYDGNKNWKFVRDNPRKVWRKRASKEYAKLLKSLPENYAFKIGAKEWAALKNMGLDEVTLNSHNFGEDGQANQLYVLRYLNYTNNGVPLLWNSYVGKLYADYLYSKKGEPQNILGVVDWLKKQYEDKFNYWVVF